MESSEIANATRSPKRRSLAKLVVFVVLLVVVVAVVLRFHDTLSLNYLASKETSLRELNLKSPLLVASVAFGIYTLITGLSLPGAALLTLIFGWFFGFARGLLLISFASTTGATIAFLLSRFFLREYISARFGERLKKFNAELAKEGAFYLFTLRLIPAIPFFVINLVMGLTPIRATTFWWVSQLGMLPGTAVYVYAGAQFPSLDALVEKGAAGILSPQLIIAFVLLGLFPITIKKLMKRLKNGQVVH